MGAVPLQPLHVDCRERWSHSKDRSCARPHRAGDTDGGLRRLDDRVVSSARRVHDGLKQSVAVTAQAPDARRFEPVSDLLILAAIHCAERHGRPKGVLWGRIREHMGLVGGASTRVLRAQVEALVASDQVGLSRRCGSTVWELTDKGRRRLARARRMGKVPELPEAPQHRDWRHARKQASEQIDALRSTLRDSLAEAHSFAERDESGAAAWFGFSRSLRTQCAELGWAIHCLYEWDEPDDARADVGGGERRRRLELARVVSGQVLTGDVAEHQPMRAAPPAQMVND